MIVVVHPTGSEQTIQLEDPDDCGSFAVRADGLTLAEVGSILEASRTGRTDSSNAFIDPGAIARLAAGRGGPGWTERLEAMLAFAKSKGWTDAQGWVQGHIEGAVQR